MEKTFKGCAKYDNLIPTEKLILSTSFGHSKLSKEKKN